MSAGQTVDEQLSVMPREDRDAIIAANEDLWNELRNGAWLISAAGSVPGFPRRLIVLTAVACARKVLHLVPDGEARPRQAIDLAETWANDGDVTVRQLRYAGVPAFNSFAIGAANETAESAHSFAIVDIAHTFSGPARHADHAGHGVQSAASAANEAAKAIARTYRGSFSKENLSTARRMVADVVRSIIVYRRDIAPLKRPDDTGPE